MIEMMTFNQALKRGFIITSGNIRGSGELIKKLWVIYNHTTKNSIYWGSKENAKRIMKTLNE